MDSNRGPTGEFPKGSTHCLIWKNCWFIPKTHRLMWTVKSHINTLEGSDCLSSMLYDESMDEESVKCSLIHMEDPPVHAEYASIYKDDQLANFHEGILDCLFVIHGPRCKLV
eukprot:4885039-Pleurochrysis_carterae.AAC.1